MKLHKNKCLGYLFFLHGMGFVLSLMSSEFTVQSTGIFRGRWLSMMWNTVEESCQGSSITRPLNPWSRTRSKSWKNRLWKLSERFQVLVFTMQHKFKNTITHNFSKVSCNSSVKLSLTIFCFNRHLYFSSQSYDNWGEFWISAEGWSFQFCYFATVALKA